MKDLVIQLRSHLGLTQSDFGRLVGRSLPSIQGYESGKKVPSEVVAKMMAVAGKNLAHDLAKEFDRRMEGRFSAEKQRATVRDLTQYGPDLHRILDEIIALGDPGAVQCIMYLLHSVNAKLQNRILSKMRKDLEDDVEIEKRRKDG